MFFLHYKPKPEPEDFHEKLTRIRLETRKFFG